jgi:putative FmdB family regulatory protein
LPGQWLFSEKKFEDLRMPIYEYKCEKCGQFEVTQKITDRPINRCPTCKGKVKKLISHTSFQLKGTGWYITDYARKEKGSKDKDSKGEKAPAADAKGNGKGGASTEAEKKSSTEKKSDKPASSEAP